MAQACRRWYQCLSHPEEDLGGQAGRVQAEKLFEPGSDLRDGVHEVAQAGLLLQRALRSRAAAAAASVLHNTQCINASLSAAQSALSTRVVLL